MGVVGTLSSALLSQRLSQSSKLKELEHQERMRGEERAAEDEQRRLVELRTCLVNLNAADRQYRDAMLAYAHSLREDDATEAEKEEVAEARRAQRDARAEAQLLASERILDAERTVSRGLQIAYGLLKKVERGRASSVRDEQLAQLFQSLAGVMDGLTHMRGIMRQELGIVDEP
ncbi:hypothetical protein AB0L06_32865 [Spirillospora sp. NPDC052269]